MNELKSNQIKAEKIYNIIKKKVDKNTLILINEYTNLQLEIEKECNQ